MLDVITADCSSDQNQKDASAMTYSKELQPDVLELGLAEFSVPLADKEIKRQFSAWSQRIFCIFA